MKRVAILYSTYSPTIDAIIYRLDNIAETETFSSAENINPKNFDLIVLCNYDGEYNINAVNVHHSLLPSFKTKDPIKDAILEGVKITGLTIFYTNPYKIITQYPIFISNDMHYDELKQELNYLEQTIYPLVIEKLLKNEQFEIKNLISKSQECSANCEGCCGCKN